MSTLKADTIQSTSGGAATLTKQQAAKMWIAFDQGFSASSAQSIDGSFNVSSITDAGTGETTISLTNAMADANHAVLCMTGSGFHNRRGVFNLPRTTLVKIEVYEIATNSNAGDAGEASAATLGDLA
jgi:hypothetical protein